MYVSDAQDDRYEKVFIFHSIVSNIVYTFKQSIAIMMYTKTVWIIKPIKLNIIQCCSTSIYTQNSKGKNPVKYIEKHWKWIIQVFPCLDNIDNGQQWLSSIIICARCYCMSDVRYRNIKFLLQLCLLCCVYRTDSLSMAYKAKKKKKRKTKHSRISIEWREWTYDCI